jgi:hypothetical protein
MDQITILIVKQQGDMWDTSCKYPYLGPAKNLSITPAECDNSILLPCLPIIGLHFIIYIFVHFHRDGTY